MSLFTKIFSSKSKSTESELKTDKRGKYMPKIKLPLDEKFTVNFKANGGKFLYCENFDEVSENLNAILDENNWQEHKALLLNKNLKDKFSKQGLNTTKKISDSTFFLTTCENLIAIDGSLLISSNQIFEKKLLELPANFIVYATTSQIVENISEGLQIIKSNHKKTIPTNITTIKNFKSEDEDDKNFLNYGSSSKNLYLLLLEDF